MTEQNDEILSLADMLPQIAGDIEQRKASSDSTISKNETSTNKAAAELFSLYGESTLKDRKFNMRFQSSVYAQMQTICRKKGLSMSAAINMLVADFINQNKDLLE